MAGFNKDPSDPTKAQLRIAIGSEDMLDILPKIADTDFVSDEEHAPEYVELLDMLAITLKMYDDDHIIAGKGHGIDVVLWARTIRDMTMRANHELETSTASKKVVEPVEGLSP